MRNNPTWNIHVPFPNLEPPTIRAPIAREAIRFSESAWVEGLPSPEDLAVLWERYKQGNDTPILCSLYHIRLHCKLPCDPHEILSRYLYHNRTLVDKLGRSRNYKFWMDLTCKLAAVRLVGCWVDLIREYSNESVFHVVLDQGVVCEPCQG
jgi:hypothetical protein